ncbi:unnamed protein product [marine sediment metagenome]|uniref:Uncharacterized protein n=1 Tax=marine sediment metagenome TaxID=412755 RepID=X0TTP8_9ZZZZ
MKFKIGQKVRVIKWLDMPLSLINKWGTNTHVGEVGVIIQQNPFSGDEGYDVKKKENKYSFFCLEEELELLVKIGEQLEFEFMLE